MMSSDDATSAAAPIIAPPTKNPFAVIWAARPGAVNDAPWHRGHLPPAAAMENRGSDG